MRNMQNSTNITTDPSANTPGKRLIRKITPIDPKKLQQSGLDRKIAEALSKQKLHMNSSKSNHTTVSASNTFPSSSTPTSVIRSIQTTTRPACSSSTVIKSAPSLQPPSPTAVTAKHVQTKIIIPPKITITGPEANTELDKQHLVGLSPEQRLKHVKHMLNKKLLLKKNSNKNDTTSNEPDIFAHLKPQNPHKLTLPINKPPTSVGFVQLKESVQTTITSKPVVETQSYPKLPVISDKPPKPTPTGFVYLKEPTTSTNKPVNKVPSSQNIIITEKPPPTYSGFEHIKQPAQTASTTRPVVKITSSQNIPIITENPSAANSFVHFKELNQTTFTTKPVANTSFQEINTRDDKEEPLQATPISKPIIKTPQKSPQDIARKLDFKTEDEVPKVIQFVKKNPTKFLYNNEKHSPNSPDTKNIPKASLKPVANAPVNKIRQLVQQYRNMDFPEVSPLKTPFPTVNVPQETPLPTIDTFKKPYPMPPSNYYRMQAETPANNAAAMEYMTANYETPPTEPTLHHLTNVNDLNETSSLVSTATNSNCLIVLENKVLSQDEMIDLTALRLSNSNVDTTQGFAKPHRPIPEVVIKQEKPDDFPVTTLASECNKFLSTEHEQQQPKTLVKNIIVQTDPDVVERQLSTEMILLPAKQNTKIIINAQKLKLPPGKIAELAKIIAQSAGSQVSSKATHRTNKVETQTQNKSTTNSDTRILNTKAVINRKILPYANKYGEEISNSVKTESNQLVVNQNSESYSANRVRIQNKTYNNKLQAKEIEKWEQTKTYKDISRTIGLKSEVNEQTSEVKQLEQQQIYNPAKQMYYPPQTSTTTELRQSMYDPNIKQNPSNSLIVKTLVNNDQIKSEQKVNEINLTTLQTPDKSLDNSNLAKTSAINVQIIKKENFNTSLIKSETDNTQFVKMYKKDQEKVNVIFKDEPKTPQYVSPPRESSKSHYENLQRSPVIKPLPPHGLKKPSIKTEDTSYFLPTSQSFPSYLNTSYTGNRKPAVEIIDEPSEIEDSFSAVDFLAAFANTNPITEETTLELSPEELNLNASCAMNLSPLRITSYAKLKRHVSSSSQKQVTKPETMSLFQSNNIPVEIGNIVNMQDDIVVDYGKSQTMSAIVIQSSKGPETIVTKTPENKCPILTIPNNKLKPVKIVNVLDSNKMGLPKLKDMEHTIKTTHTSFKDSQISTPLTTKSNTDFEVSYKNFLDNPKKYIKSDVKVKKTRKTLSKKPIQKTVEIPYKKAEVSFPEISFQTPVNTTEKSVESLVNTAEKSDKSPKKKILKQNSRENIEKLINTETLTENRPEPTVSQEFKSVVAATEKSVQPTEKSVKLPEKCVKSPVKSPMKSILKLNSREDIEKLINTQVLSEKCTEPTVSQEFQSTMETTEKSVQLSVKTPIKSVLKENSMEDFEKLINTEALNKKCPELTKSQEFKSIVKTTEKSVKSPVKATETPVKIIEKSVKSLVKTPIKSILKPNSQEYVEKLINTEALNEKGLETKSKEFESTVKITEKSFKLPIKATETVKSPVKTLMKSMLKQNFQEDIEMLMNTEITEKCKETSESQEFKETPVKAIEKSVKSPVKSPIKSILKQSSQKEIEILNNLETTEKRPETTELQEFKSSTGGNIQNSLPARTLVKLTENFVSFQSILKQPVPTETDQDKQTGSFEEMTFKSSVKLKCTNQQTTPSNVSTITNKYDIQKDFPAKTSVKSPEKLFNLKSILKSNATPDIQQNQQESFEVISTTSTELVEIESRDPLIAEDNYSTKSEELKSLQDSEQSKSNNSNSSNANVPSKRISRFKKGKINLVQRNKKSVTTDKCLTGAEENKPKSESSLDETKIADATNTSVIRAATQDIDEVSNESGSVLHNESQIIPASHYSISQNQQLISKDLEISEYKDSKEIPTDVFNTKISNTSGCNDSLTPNKISSNTASTTFSIPDLNATEEANIENDIEMPVSNPQYSYTTEEENKESGIEIQKTTTEYTNLPNNLNKADLITCNNQDKNKDIDKDLTQSIGPGNEDVLLSTEQKSSDIIETPPKNISQLLNPPKMPKRKPEIKKIEELSPDSKQILEELRQAKVSLVDIVKHSPTEISQNPPKIPFKRKCTEIPITTEEPKGINTLLKLKKSIEKEYNKDLQKGNEENKQDEENCASNTNVNNIIKENHLEFEIDTEKPTTSENSTKPKRGRPTLIKVDKSILEKKEEAKQDEEGTLNLHNPNESTPLSISTIQHKISKNQYESEISSEDLDNSKKEIKKRRGRPPSKIIDKSILENMEENQNEEYTSKSHSKQLSTTNINDLLDSGKSSEEPSASETETKRKRGRPSLKNIDKSMEGTKKDEKIIKNKKHLSESEISTTLINKRSSRFSLNSEIPILPAKPINQKTRHCSRLQISDDDLEFLPICTENKKLKVSNEKNKIKEKDIESASEKSIKRTRLSSKPIEMEATTSVDTRHEEKQLVKHPPTPVTKRTRFSSQVSETDNTNRTRCSSKPTDPEDSCQDSPYDVNLSPTKQRKKLRKTLEDIKKSSKRPYLDTDSEDDRDFDAIDVIDEGNEFLGFEENSEGSSKLPKQHATTEDDISSKILGFEENSEGFSNLPKQHDTTEDDNSSKKLPTTTATKASTMKNWLTTGKAISPTFNKDPNAQRFRHDIKLSRGVPLKKRFDFAKNHHDETDITDDTSPAEDEDDSDTNFTRKRGSKNVIDSNRNMLDSKKAKLDKTEVKQHKFREPRPVDKVTKNSGTDTNRPEVSLKRSKELITEETDTNIEDIRQNVKMPALSASDNLDKSNDVFDSIKVADNTKIIANPENESSHSKNYDCFNKKAENVDIPGKEVLNSKTKIVNDENTVCLHTNTAVISAVQTDINAEDESHIIEDSCSKETIFKAKKQNQGDSCVISEKIPTIVESIKPTIDSSPNEKSHEKQDSCHKTSSKTEENSNAAVALEEETKLTKFDKPQESSTKHKKTKISKEQNEQTECNKSQNLEMLHKKEIEDSLTIGKDIEELPETSSSRLKKTKTPKDKKGLAQIEEATTSSKSKNFSKEHKTNDLQTTQESSTKHETSKGVKLKMKLSETPVVSDKNHTMKLKEPPTTKEISETVARIHEIKSSSLTPLSSTSKSKILSERTIKIEDSNNECSPRIPKKRGRKPKPKIKDSSDEDCAPRIPKKRGRKRKYQISDSSDESTSLGESGKHLNISNTLQSITAPHLATIKHKGTSDVLSTPPSVGRRRKVDAAEINFNPRLLLIKKREQLENDDVLTEANEGTGDIQCGLCLGRTTAKKWILHLAEHYGIGWQVGGEKLNIENRSLVLSGIINYYKFTDIKGLNCRMCNKLYRSALGVLQHIEGCGAETVRVVCEYCKRDLAKASLNIHLRSCSERLKLESSFIENMEEAEEKPQQDVFSNTGRLKRHSTIKAENKLKALGAILVEPHEFNPQDLMHYVPPLDSDEVHKKWSEDIEEFGKGFCPKTVCKFNSPIMEELENHIMECKQINTGYFCISCKTRRFDTKTQVIEHINSSHKPRKDKKKNDSDSDCNLKTDDEQSSDEDNYFSDNVEEYEIDDEEVEEDADDADIVDSDREHAYSDSRSAKRNVKGFGKNNYHPYKRVYEARAIDINKEVYNKWKKFLSLNYSPEPILPAVTSQYSIINNQDFAKYLPTQISSMKFYMNKETKLNKEIGFPETNVEWLELKRFETMETKKTETFFFLGAPIKFVCWVPLPDNVEEQYLVVGYRKEMFKFIKHTQPNPHTTVLMIFKITLLNKLPKIEVHYGFTINDGPVHCVAFLPSGGYSSSTNRLGLVAVGTVNAITKIYSLPIEVEIKECDKIENVAIIDIQPSFQLNLDVIDQGKTEHLAMKPQCLNILWSESSGHNLIFAGFSNGFIGIWDITDDYQENLNRFVVENIVNFAALNYFYIGEKGINCFALHYDTGGPRWLAISAKYRKFVIYDIKNLMMPTVIKDEWNKNILQCMDWCPLWGPLLTGYSDAIPNNGRCIMDISPVNITFTQQRIDYMCSGVTQIHYTPVSNMCVFAVDNGDIVFTDPREFHYEIPLGRKYDPSRRIVASMAIKQFNEKEIFKPPTKQQQAKLTSDFKFPSNWSLYDQDYKNKYGLVFNPFVKIKESNKTAYMNEKRRAPINITPLMRINSLRCNLNLNAKRLVAAGYENGFLRILYFNKEYIFSKT